MTETALVRSIQLPIIGIDPGLAAMGLAFLDGRHVLSVEFIETKPSKGLDIRLEQIRRELSDRMGVTRWAVFCEDQRQPQVQQSKSGRSNVTMGDVREVCGVLRAVVADRGGTFGRISAARWKSTLGLKQSAKGEQVERVVRAISGYTGELNGHMADALGVALAGERFARIGQRVKERADER